MVCASIRAFSLSLTDAATGEVRREYADARSEDVWIKGEQGEEFFLRLKNDDTCDAVCIIHVDGVDLGYRITMPSRRESPLLGVPKSGQSWSDSTVMWHALQFVERKRDDDDGSRVDDDEDRRLPEVGSVKVDWYQCEYDRDRTLTTGTEAVTKPWPGNSSGVSSSTMHKKEQSQLCSKEGSSVAEFTNRPTAPFARRGPLLATTKILYTSDFGLAVRGLLSAEECGMAPKRHKRCTAVE